MSNMKNVDLSTIGSGVLSELFAEDFQKILDNIADENTKADAVRELTLKVKIVPSEDRGTAAMQISSSAKLAPVKPYKGFMFLARKEGKVRAFEQDTTQPNLPEMSIVKKEAKS